MKLPITIIIAIIILILLGFDVYRLFGARQSSNPETAAPENTIGHQATHMKISSPAFQNSQSIPAKYTCDGDNINPALYFSDVPTNTKSLALIVDDPDAPAGNFTHWLIWNINSSSTSIEENNVPEGTTQGLNDAGKHSYFGPCPPSNTHHYHFKLYALDAFLEIDASSQKTDLERAMEGHIITQTELVGLYQRK